MQLKHLLRCPSCKLTSGEFDLVNSEVLRCQSCGHEAYEWSFKRA